MLDSRLLDASALEFIVVSDTHYMRVPEGQAVEMESRRRQSARALHALRVIGSAEAAFTVHLGDLVQEFPGTPGFAESVGLSLAQMEQCGVRPRHVAGNHDVGDKPDPTMPTDWASSDVVSVYHRLVGQSWYSWDAGGYHFVVLNSQIMNSGLPEESEQAQWLEADLAAHAGEPVIVFLHLAPFIVDASEPGLAHYDNIDEPARSKLIGVLEQHNVQLLFAGHSHFRFFNRIGGIRFFVTPSTSFTRPGFSEMFASVAPPEQGRDDTAKLGFFLVRLADGQPRVHLIRTEGLEGEPDSGVSRVVSRLPVDLPSSPLGVVARHPIAPAGEVPVAWPSLIRQPMRNDYPLLACIELGARYLRVPASDLSNPAQRERLAMLRDEGVEITGVWIWSQQLDLWRQVQEAQDVVDAVEVQFPGELLPETDLIYSISRDVALPVSIAPLMPREQVPGKQHARARIGYRVAELPELQQHLQREDVVLDGVVVRIDAVDSPWQVMLGARDVVPIDHVRQVDWLVETGTTDPLVHSIRVAEALFGAALHPGCRVFLDPLADLDRTMDVSLGLIDRMSNPNPAFHVARVLNSALFRNRCLRTWASHPAVDGARCYGLESDTERYLLILSEDGLVDIRSLREALDSLGDGRVFDLQRGTSTAVDAAQDIEGPVLVVIDRR